MNLVLLHYVLIQYEKFVFHFKRKKEYKKGDEKERENERRQHRK